MLIILPPSETKRAPAEHGDPVDIEALSFPSLNLTRRAILDGLIATSAGADAFRRLSVGPSMAAEVARNTRLRELPARPVLEVYSGPLHAGLDAPTLSPAAARRAADRVVVASALWGLLRPTDRIPPYRMHVCSRLVGMDRLEPAWREVLPAVLAAVAGDHGLVLELRSPSYLAIGTPTGMADRTVLLHVAQGSGPRRVGDVIAKRVRGQAVRHLLESGIDPSHPGEVAGVLGERWPANLDPPVRAGRLWTLTLLVTD